METWHLRLALLPSIYSICRLPADAPIPPWAEGGSFLSITRTSDELSIVCPAERVPAGILADTGWRCLKVEGPFDLTAATGVLASIAGMSVFAVATYDTDYILVTSAHLERALAALTAAGHNIVA